VSAGRTRRRLVIHGRVQGVAFRAATLDAAARAGVAGWVRNRADGTVEAVLEGAPDAVAQVEDFCARGPSLARVARVEASDEPPQGLEGFRVR
jgi:acylphosphatase